MDLQDLDLAHMSIALDHSDKIDRVTTDERCAVMTTEDDGFQELVGQFRKKKICDVADGESLMGAVAVPLNKL